MGHSALRLEHKGTQATPSPWAGPCLCSKTLGEVVLTEPPVPDLCIQRCQGRNERLAKGRTPGSLASGRGRKCM